MLARNTRAITIFISTLLVTASAGVATTVGASDEEHPAEARQAERRSQQEQDLVERFRQALTGSRQARGGGASGDSATSDKLEVHGFLTQAYADANFVDAPLEPSPTSDEVALGIPEDGTADYRFLALQFRYEISAKDIMIVQLSSRTLGNSPVQFVEDDVELDWAFYERRVGDNTSVKVGRVQIPFGIYNEIRDVGTILPFYRPAYNLYREGAFTSETVDGLAISHVFAAESDWSLEVDVYGGEWDQFEQDLDNPANSRLATAKDAYGIQLWLNTPYLSMLRFGLGANTRDLVGSLQSIEGQAIPYDTFLVSIDANWEKFVVRAEYEEFDPIFPGDFPVEVTLAAYYYQVGYLPNDQIQIWAQFDVGSLEADAVFLTEPEKRNIREDLGVSVNYFFSPNVVLKAEHHWVEETVNNNEPTFFPDGSFLLTPNPLDAPNGSYYILSLSVSF